MDVDGMMTYIFQSTRSARSATGHSALCVGVPDISIHALRKERDHILHTGQFLRTHFNPRAPQGARLLYLRALRPAVDFNPRAPQGARQQKWT